MTRDTSPNSKRLAADFEAVARRMREDVGAPPSDQELEALAAGRLAAAEAERVRNFLALHPEWADAYLEMISAEPRSLPTVPENGKRRVWRAVESQIARGVRRTPKLKVWLPMAAAMLLALTSWLFLQGDRYPEVYVPSAARGATVEVPRSEPRVQLVAALGGHDLRGSYELVLGVGEEEIIASQVKLRPRQETISLVVPTDRLHEEATYRVILRKLDSPGESIRLTTFRMRFVE